MNTTTQEEHAATLAALDAKVHALLPARYQHCFSSVSPSSMGSTPLRYDADGRVAWDQIWTTFCDLALAGGPPHRGTLLEPVPEAEATSDPDRYACVAAEIRRGIELTTCLPTLEGFAPGWVGAICASEPEAVWLQFAVTAENVSVRRRGAVLYLPTSPAFRAEKEIKNVVVALAKAHHYWDGHLTESQQSLGTADVWEPATPTEADTAAWRAAASAVAAGCRAAGAVAEAGCYAGWVAVAAPDEAAAVWLLRAVLVERVLARREGAVLYLPVGVPDERRVTEVIRVLTRAWSLWGVSQRSLDGSQMA